MAGGSREWLRDRCIGRGSTASVYLAAATTGQGGESTFAVKSAELSRSKPLQREQKILSSLCNPHVVSCLGSDVTVEPDGRVLYNLFMEYVPGGSLAEAIKREGSLDGGKIRVYTRGILNGLAYLHGRGIVHCDVKGHNILLGENDMTVKVADLGCARWIDGGEDHESMSGTPLYMAPEVARGEEQGPAADIWALGCTVIEMATGCPPWRDVADPVAAIHRIAFSTEVPEVPCDVSDDAKDFMRRCLSRDPRKRWSAEMLLNHPFVDCSEESTEGCMPLSKKTSPKSTLDQVFWDSWTEEEDDGEEYEAKAHVAYPLLGSLQERLQQLVGDVVSPSPAANATWDDNCWVTVRSGVALASSSEASSSERFEVSIAEDESSTSPRLSVEAAVAESAGYSDCQLEGCLPSIPYSYFPVRADNVVRSCTDLSLDDQGDDLFVYNHSSSNASLAMA